MSINRTAAAKDPSAVAGADLRQIRTKPKSSDRRPDRATLSPLRSSRLITQAELAREPWFGLGSTAS